MLNALFLFEGEKVVISTNGLNFKSISAIHINIKFIGLFSVQSETVFQATLICTYT